MIPLILVHSFGQEKASKIIEDVLHTNGSRGEKFTIQEKYYNIEAYRVNITTKYYKTEIALFEWEDLEYIPKNIEGCIIYFDAESVSFASKIDDLDKFVKKNNIGFSCLLTKNFSQTGANSLVRTKCALSHFAIIDLYDDENSGDGAYNGYNEVIEMLKNNIWSNVLTPSKGSHNLIPDSTNDELQEDDNDVEKQLNEFEDLLNSIQQFKVISQNLSRDEVLNNAERLAEHFASILGEDEKK